MPITATQYPVNLILEGRPCLVVGGGPVAARKAEGLLACGAQVTVLAAEVGHEVRALGAVPAPGAVPSQMAPAPAFGGGPAAPANGPAAPANGAPVGAGGEVAPGRFLRGSLTWHERAYHQGEAVGHCLVIAATGDQTVNRAVAADAEAAGVWVNVADDPGACMFTLPAVLREGPVTVAVSTAGHSPALAGWLRDRLAEVVGPEHSALAGLLAEAREELRAKGRPTEGLDWQSILDSDMLGEIRDGQVNRARERLRACLSLP